MSGLRHGIQRGEKNSEVPGSCQDAAVGFEGLLQLAEGFASLVPESSKFSENFSTEFYSR